MESGKGGSPKGLKSGKTTIPFETIQEIRRRWETRPTIKRLSREYGIPEHTISSWLRYQSRVDE